MTILRAWSTAIAIARYSLKLAEHAGKPETDSARLSIGCGGQPRQLRRDTVWPLRPIHAASERVLANLKRSADGHRGRRSPRAATTPAL